MGCADKPNYLFQASDDFVTLHAFASEPSYLVDVPRASYPAQNRLRSTSRKIADVVHDLIERACG